MGKIERSNSMARGPRVALGIGHAEPMWGARAEGRRYCVSLQRGDLSKEQGQKLKWIQSYQFLQDKV